MTPIIFGVIAYLAVGVAIGVFITRYDVKSHHERGQTYDYREAGFIIPMSTIFWVPAIPAAALLGLICALGWLLDRAVGPAARWVLTPANVRKEKAR